MRRAVRRGVQALGAAVAVSLGVGMAVAGCGLLDPGARDEPGDGVSVAMARATWSTGYFQAEVYHQLLERLGYEVNDPAEHELSPSDFYPALARGEFDFWVNGWIPTTLLEEPVEGLPGVVGDHVDAVGLQIESGAVEGILIDIASADRLGVRYLDDIAADPELAAEFDVDGNGKADIFGCPDPWVCDDVIDDLIASLDSDLLEQVRGDYDENFDRFRSRVLRGQPSLGYTWTPNFTIAVLQPGSDVRWLAVQSSDVDPVTLPAGQCSASPCRTGWRGSNIRVVANSEFLAEHPAAQALFDAVRIPAADVAQQNLEMDRGASSSDDIRSAASAWIAANRALVADWLAYARSQA